jgi:hypothetical protein
MKIERFIKFCISANKGIGFVYSLPITLYTLSYIQLFTVC